MKFGNLFKSDLPREPHGRSHAWGGFNTARREHAQTSGFVAGTKVATEFGWRAVEALQEDDLILTFDNGLQKVAHIERSKLRADRFAPSHHLPLRVPAGALGNDAEMMLLPDQAVMLESDLAEVMFDDAFVMLPAVALLNYKGIERTVAQDRVEIIVLHFESEQVVFANDNALMHCMGTRSSSLDALLDGTLHEQYDVLPMAAAEAFVAAMRLGAASMPGSMISETPGYSGMVSSL